MALTSKEELFAQEYVKGKSMTEAYRTAYSVKHGKPETVNRNAYRVYQRSVVQEYINELREIAKIEVAVTVRDVVEELKKLAFTNLPGIVKYGHGVCSVEEFEKLTDAQRACIKKFKMREIPGKTLADPPTTVVEIELYDKVAALMALGKHLGMFVEKTETTITDHTEVKVAEALFASMTEEERDKALAKLKT